MQELITQVDANSEQYQTNFAYHSQLRQQLRDHVAEVAKGGSERSRQRHLDRGRLLPRERVRRLLDPGSPFLEIGALAAFGMYNDDAPAAGLIAGIGRVEGRYVMIVCNDSTVKGGTYYPITVKKHLRAQEIALENRLPCLYLVDSGGAFLPRQDEVFPDRDHFGRIFYNQSQLSSRGIPQIAAVLGSSTAGGAYVPAMSDETVIVRNQGTIFLGGPPLVKAATGEVVTAEDLGGGDLHARDSGVVDHAADDDAHALEVLRDIVATLPPPRQRAWEVHPPAAPALEVEELYGVVPTNPLVAYDVREVIGRIADGSEFHEFKKEYGSTLVTGVGRNDGQQVGRVADRGVMFAGSALSGAHILQLYDQLPNQQSILVHVAGCSP